MASAVTLNELWDSSPEGKQRFRAETLAGLPEVAQRYLSHAIAPDTKLARAVRLRMHGEIKLNQWLPFQAEQVIVWERGMIWQANVRMNGLPIRGSDRLIDGQGRMAWKLLGLFPIMVAGGENITRSTIGRMQGEIIWLPSVLCQPGVVWTAPDASHAHACLTLLGESVELILTIDPQGRLEQVQFKRWGNPEGAEHHFVEFGGFLQAERTIDGYTIPTQLRIGWYFGSDRFETKGEFFRATIEGVTYR